MVASKSTLCLKSFPIFNKPELAFLFMVAAMTADMYQRRYRSSPCYRQSNVVKCAIYLVGSVIFCKPTFITDMSLNSYEFQLLECSLQFDINHDRLVSKVLIIP